DRYAIRAAGFRGWMDHFCNRHDRVDGAGDLAPGPMKATAAWIAAAVVIVAAMTAGRIDISAARFFRSDVVVRDAFPGVTEPPYYDPAPYSLWLPSDWFVWESIRSGHLPLWDRVQGG